jgi:hypothetical protein
MRHRRRVVQESGLGELAKARRAYATAEARLRREVLFAYDAGSSLRAIAETVDLSPETVRAWIATARAERQADVERIDRMSGMAGLSVSAVTRSEQERRALASKWKLNVQDSDK